MFKWKVSGLGGGSSKKAKNSQSQNNDKLNNAKILPNNANVALPASAAENNNSQHDQNEQAKNNKNNKEGNNKSPSKKYVLIKNQKILKYSDKYRLFSIRTKNKKATPLIYRFC